MWRKMVRQGTAKGGCAVMKALFIRCNGKLTPDMLVGGLIDMGCRRPIFEQNWRQPEFLPILLKVQILTQKYQLIIFVFRKKKINLFC